jgi:hypothetical protein
VPLSNLTSSPSLTRSVKCACRPRGGWVSTKLWSSGTLSQKPLLDNLPESGVFQVEIEGSEAEVRQTCPISACTGLSVSYFHDWPPFPLAHPTWGSSASGLEAGDGDPVTRQIVVLIERSVFELTHHAPTAHPTSLLDRIRSFRIDESIAFVGMSVNHTVDTCGVTLEIPP